MNVTKHKAPGRWLYASGGFLTLLYLAALALYCIRNWSTITGLEANNVGDFLAGAFSPLAFAWLVLGFIQQGIELRQNSAALQLQADELRNAAKHAGEMVELQRRDFELRIQELEEARLKTQKTEEAAAKKREEQAVQKIQPIFNFGFIHRDMRHPHFADGTLSNRGGSCSKVRIQMEPIEGSLDLIGVRDFDEFASQLEVPVRFLSTSRARTHPLEIHYTDSAGTERSQSFILSEKERDLDIAKQRT